jgi:hypothetical protein
MRKIYASFGWYFAGALVSLIFCYFGCAARSGAGGTTGTVPTVTQVAVETVAAANGFIAEAQVNHLALCKANPALSFPCGTITQAIGAQNALLDALETYCALPAKPTAAQLQAQGAQTCAPVSSAQSALVSAIANLSALLPDIQRAAGKTTP